MSRRSYKKPQDPIMPLSPDDEEFDDEDMQEEEIDEEEFDDEFVEASEEDPECATQAANNFGFADDDLAVSPDSYGAEDIEFSSEELALSLKFIVSDIAEVINAKIVKAPLSSGCKKAFKSVVGVFFSRDVYLSYVSNPEKPRLNLQLELEHVVLSSSVDDVTQSEYHQIKQHITDSWSFILSRARDGMERQLQMQKRIEQRSGEALSFKSLPAEPQKPVGKSIKSLFFKR
ncbi:MAG: hypothetical protein PHX06_06455 [Methanocorpusculum parvum]|nr:hypothetical protein [Methanocorpusculum parvum]